MPEGPEVRVVTESLSNDLVDVSITSIQYEEKRINALHKKNIPGYIKLSSLLPCRVTGMSAKGKKIIFWLDEGKIFLVASLGMTGRFCWEPANHTHMTFQLNNGKTLYYDDARGFGGVTVCFSVEELHNALKDVGPCLLNERHLVTPELWRNKINNKRIKDKQIGDYLMTQKYFSSIGNYLKSEILYRVAISPYRTLSSLTEEEIERLRVMSFEVIDESYSYGGLTIENYWDPHGRKGTYPCRVYGRKIDPLGNPIEVVTLKDNRSTYWCPAIQK